MNKSCHTKRNRFLFIVPSLLGILFFMVPLPTQDGMSIPIAIMKDGLLALMGDSVGMWVAVTIALSAICSVLTKLFKPAFILNHRFLNGVFNVSIPWLIVRLIGFAFTLMVIAQRGFGAVIHAETGTFVFNDLLTTLFAVFIFAGFLLPLLTNFGLLDLFGTVLTKVMRPLFKLPGRSAIDCIASWLGDGSVGVIMSSRQYEEKKYSQKEAAIIGTTFSAVSISFCLVVISQLHLDHLFTQFYLTVCLAGTVVAIIVSRIPPLSRKKNELIDGSSRPADAEDIPEGYHVFSYGYQKALETTHEIKQVRQVLKEGFYNVVDMLFGILPSVMAIGTIGLIVATYTPLFEWLGVPFIPLLKLLQIPMAEEASHTMVVGFADMFIPSILAANFENELTRFVIGAVSVTQLIFMSEIGALILGSKIPVNLLELFIIFIQRTLISLPVIALMAHWIF